MPGEEGTRVSHISHPGSPGTLVTALSIWMCPFSILNWQANKYICAVKHALWKQPLCLRINGYIRLMKHIPCLTYLSWQQQSIKTNRLPFAYRQCISILGNHWPETILWARCSTENAMEESPQTSGMTVAQWMDEEAIPSTHVRKKIHQINQSDTLIKMTFTVIK